MANVAVNDLFLVTFRGTLYNQAILNTFGFRIISSTVPPSYETFSSELSTALQAVGALKDKFLLCSPADYTLQQLWIQRVYPVRMYKRIFVVNAPGALASDAGTTNLAAVITRRGELANRHNVSTLHVCIPATLGNVIDGGFTAGLKTALDNLALEMLPNYVLPGGPTEIEPVILQAPLGFAAKIIQTTVQTTPRVMRRRTIGVGE